MFGGFKATLNLLGGNKKTSEICELSSDLSVTGAYRVNREDVYGFSTQDVPKSRPSKPKQTSAPLRTVQSTSNLVPSTANQNIRNSTPVISRDPRGDEQTNRTSGLTRKDIKNHEKEQKKLEKQRLANQKKQAQEQAKLEKMVKEQAKKDAQKAKSGRKTKTQAPQPQTQPKTSPQTNPMPQPAYSTNTIDSSISRSSGPPPYSETNKPEQSKEKSNVVYSKPVDNGSWDIISQHREQMNRPAASASMEATRKQVLIDLNYNFGATSDKKENSEV